jgi:hypothetical protein
LLRADEALVSYLVLEDRVLIWVLRPGRPLTYHDETLAGARANRPRAPGPAERGPERES